MNTITPFRAVASAVCLVFAGFLSLTGLTGCLVAGYSSGGGWFVWPGSIVLTLIAFLFFFLMRRR